MVLSKKVRVSPGGIHGKCWFAAEDIKKGEMIWELGDMVYHDVEIPKSVIQTWPRDKQDKFMSLAYQVRDGIYRGSDPNQVIPEIEQDEYFVNHCCDGNCWYVGDDRLEALRDIKEGEELCYDYALTEADEDWVLAEKCLCGAARCRGRVTGNDWLKPELQKLYEGHFTEYITGKINASK